MAHFPTVIKGARVLDGSGAPAYVADVALDGERIVRIGARLAGGNEINGEDACLAPGFIDTHTHSDLMLLGDPAMALKVHQGVTLDIVGQDGVSVAPIQPRLRDSQRRQLTAWAGFPEMDWTWTTTADYLHQLDQNPPALDAAYLVPHGNLRRWVIGDEDRLATGSELQQMCHLAREALGEGAVGLSTGLIYQPCSYADTHELEALCRVAAEFGRPFVIHLRSESNLLLEALDEVLAIGRHTGVPIHVSHFKIAGPPHWGFLPRVIARIQDAQNQGVRVTADQYPYVAGSTTLGTVLPPWALSGGTSATLERLADPELRARIRWELSEAPTSDWENIYRWIGPEGIVVSDVPSGNAPDLVGKHLAEAARLRRCDPLELTMDLLLAEKMAVTMICFSQSEEVVAKLIQQPWVNICSDGLVGGKPHPRAYGAFPRVLARYVREQGLLTWEEAIRKMTSQAADSFQLTGYGRIREGDWASLVLFHAKTVADTATFAHARRHPTGITHVWVRGVPVLANGQLTGKRPGRAVRALTGPSSSPSR